MELGSRRTKFRLRPALFNVGLAVGGVLLALFGAELAVRAVGLDPNDQPLPPTAAALPRSLPSERSYFAPWKRAVVEVNSNRLGLRDWDHPGDEAPKILGLGDSFTFGFGVELEETYLSVAERALWDAAPRLAIGIYKLGLNGSSQYVQFEALRSKWSSIRPSMVVIGFSEDTDIEENVLQDPLLKRLLAGERISALSGTAARDALHRHSALVRFLEARKLRGALAREVEALDAIIASWGGVRPGFEDLLRAGWQRRFIDAFGDKLDAEWRLTETLLDEIRQFSSDNGAELALFRIPSRFAVDPSSWRDAVENICGKKPEDVRATCGNVDPEHTAKRLERYARSHGLLYVDPGRELAASITAGEPIYFKLPEIHWTRYGHEKAGRVLADALAAHLRLGEYRRARSPVTKARRLGALWTPPSESSLTAAAWLLPLQKDEERARSQTLLWAGEARVDFLILPVAFGDDRAWSMGRETSAMLQRITSERREGLSDVGVAFSVVASKPEGDPEPTREGFDDLLRRYVEPSAAAYARACGRPLLFVDRPGSFTDDRFVVVRGSHGGPIGGADAWCSPSEQPLTDGTCSELSSATRFCVDDVLEGKGFEGDPDLLVADTFNGTKRDRIEPRPPDGRLPVVLVADSIGRWKDGESGARRPSDRTLMLYRSSVPLDLDLAGDRAVPVFSARFSCNGCFPLEKAQTGAFLWTTDVAEIAVHGLLPNRKYAVTLRVVDAGAASHIAFRSEAGATEDVPLHPGETSLPAPLITDAHGTVRWSLRVRPFRGRDRIAGSTDARLLGVALSDVRVSLVDRVPGR